MEEIKVRKPKFSKIFGRSTNKWYKWYYSLPKNGERIKLTWLPNPKNHPTVNNCYIGAEGIVQDMNETPLTDGSFTLKMDTAILIVNTHEGERGYNYIKLNDR